MLLMLKDNKVLQFDFESEYIRVINKQLLPFCLRSGKAPSLFALSQYLPTRMLSLSRSNAKQILKSEGYSTNIELGNSMKIVLGCRAVSVIDSYWLKGDDEDISFEDVNIRHKPLEKAMIDVALLGKYITLGKNVMGSELTTGGMFRKCWQRMEGELYLLKSDDPPGFKATYAELFVSEVLDGSNVNHIGYEAVHINDMTVCRCKNFVTDDESFVPAWQVSDRQVYIDGICKQDFAKMCVVDYVIANIDRHGSNWGFIYDPDTCKIKRMAPLFDHNVSLEYDIRDNEDYEPTESGMLDAAVSHYADSDIKFSYLSDALQERYDRVRKLA
jgi:hypothetical protein